MFSFPKSKAESFFCSLCKRNIFQLDGCSLSCHQCPLIFPLHQFLVIISLHFSLLHLFHAFNSPSFTVLHLFYTSISSHSSLHLPLLSRLHLFHVSTSLLLSFSRLFYATYWSVFILFSCHICFPFISPPHTFLNLSKSHFLSRTKVLAEINIVCCFFLFFFASAFKVINTKWTNYSPSIKINSSAKNKKKKKIFR